MEDSDHQAYFGEHVATLGDRITAAREAQGLSQADFARTLGVELKTVENWENDQAEPRANKVQMMSGVLGVSVSWLLIGEGDGIPAPMGATLPKGVQDILDELRQLRSDMTQQVRQLGNIEKRLQSAVR